MMKSKILAFLAALGLAACGGGGGISGTGAALGTMRLSLTDAPACGYDHVYVTVAGIRVNQTDAPDGDASWVDVPLSTTQRIDLLDYRNGTVLSGLGTVQLPAGTYTQMRLTLAANGTGAPYANAVVPTGGSETALDTPSAQQSGLKLAVNMTVPEGKVADFMLDFDACKSVIKAGRSGKYNLKPVIAVTPVLSDAGLRVVGQVDAALAAAGATVSVQQPDGNGSPVVVKSTVPDALTGTFNLYPVPAGNYNLVVTGTGRVAAVVTGVPVVTTAWTTITGTITPPAATGQGAVSGSVTPDTATVRALQPLTAGPTVEVLWAPLTPSATLGTADFAFTLPQGAPVRAPYVAGVAPVFAADTAAASQFSVEAALGTAVKSQPVDATVGATGLVFTLP